MAMRSSTAPDGHRDDPYKHIASVLRALRRSLARLAALMAATRHVPDTAPPPGLQFLTRYERRVIRLIADPHEWKYPVIAGKLHIHLRTLDGHRRRACEKLGVRTRAGLVRAAVLWGLA